MALGGLTPRPADDRLWAIVLAGGLGRRFGPAAKQFERVAGVRMVDRAVAAARRACGRVSLVLPQAVPWDGEPVDALAVGGDHQSESVRAGLRTVPDDVDIVVIADPAHPLAPDALFAAVIEAVRGGADGAVPVLPILEVVQRVAGERVIDTLDKEGLVLTQTPHAFRADVLRAVHRDGPRFPENSGLLVHRGYRVVAVPGDPANLHVATPRDLAVVDALANGLSRTA